MGGVRSLTCAALFTRRLGLRLGLRLLGLVTRVGTKQMSFCVLAQFKNESHILDEWISHYKWQGASAFFLINNDSTDDFESLECMKSVKLYHKAGIGKQPDNYNFVCSQGVFKPYDFVLVVDLDEFVFGLHNRTISQYLSLVPQDVSRIFVHWSMFGSSGFIEQPKEVRTNFTWRESKNHELYKCFIRVKNIKRIEVHDSSITTGNTIYADDALQLNHYAIQSWDFFSKVKMTRGDAAHPANHFTQSIRDEAYFKAYDKLAEVEDLTLLNLVTGLATGLASSDADLSTVRRSA